MFTDRDGPTHMTSVNGNGHVEHAEAETGYLIGTGLSRRSRIPENPATNGNAYLEVWRA